MCLSLKTSSSLLCAVLMCAPPCMCVCVCVSPPLPLPLCHTPRNTHSHNRTFGWLVFPHRSQMLRFALAQLAPSPGDVPANVSTVISTIQAQKGIADVLVFPELFLTGYEIGTERVSRMQRRVYL